MKSKGGRPRQYATPEESRRVKRENDRERQRRLQSLKRTRSDASLSSNGTGSVYQPSSSGHGSEPNMQLTTTSTRSRNTRSKGDESNLTQSNLSHFPWQELNFPDYLTSGDFSNLYHGGGQLTPYGNKGPWDRHTTLTQESPTEAATPQYEASAAATETTNGSGIDDDYQLFEDIPVDPQRNSRELRFGLSMESDDLFIEESRGDEVSIAQQPGNVAHEMVPPPRQLDNAEEENSNGKLVDFLITQVLIGHGCTAVEHEKQHQDLEARLERQAHERPDIAYGYTNFERHSQKISAVLQNELNVLATTDPEYSSGPVAKFLDIPLDTSNPLSVRDCQKLFEGIVNVVEDRRRPNAPYTGKYVMDNYENTQSNGPGQAIVSFDVDSLICMPSSLGVARRGLQICFYSSRAQNIEQDIHLDLLVQSENGGLSKRVPCHKIPHTYLGRVVGFEDCRLYIFFPQLASLERPTNYLTESEYARFIDLFLNTIHCVVSDDGISQHYPNSFLDAKAKNFAKSRETGVGCQSEGPKSQLFHYNIQQHSLNIIWERLRSTLEGSGFHDLADPVLLLNAKNMKTMFRSVDATKVVEQFLETWNYSFNPAFLKPHSTWIDIGKETITSRVENGMKKSHTCLWRTCCLKKISEEFKNQVPRSGFQKTLYRWGLTDEFGNMTLIPGKTHPLHLLGLRYSQFYSSSKEIFDAGKVYPFSEDNLEVLAIDEKLEDIWNREGNRSGAKLDRKKLQSMYIRSKQRVAIAIKAAEEADRSYGIREEHRMSWELFEQVGRRLREHPITETRRDSLPLPVVSFPARVFLNFLYWNISKYAYGFEYSLCRDGGKTISSESTKMATMFLRLLKSSMGGTLIQRDSGMWIDVGRQPDNGHPRQGIGLQSTLEDLQYGFIKSGKIDWDGWRFYPEVSQSILFQFTSFRAKFWKRYIQIDCYSDLHYRISHVFQWLRRDVFDGQWTRLQRFNAVSSIWTWVCSILVWEFQREVLDFLKEKRLLSIEHQVDGVWVPNRIPFSEKGMSSVLGTTLHWGSDTAQSPLERLRHLWGFDDNQRRENWDRRKYRSLYAHIVTAWNVRFQQHGWKWEDMEFFKFFIRHNWIWPNASGSKWWTKSSCGNQYIWQGIDVTCVWWSKPERWMPAGLENMPISPRPRRLDCELLTIEPEAYIAKIAANRYLNGDVSTWDPDHLAVYHYRWDWGDSDWRKSISPKLIRLASGIEVYENARLMSNEEVDNYDFVHDHKEVLLDILFKGFRIWCYQQKITRSRLGLEESHQYRMQFLQHSPFIQHIHSLLRMYYESNNEKPDGMWF